MSSSSCFKALLIAFHGVSTKDTSLPLYVRLWMDSCQKLFSVGVVCYFNIVLFSPKDTRSTMDLLRTFSTNHSSITSEISHVITKTWTRAEFTEKVTSLGIDVKPLFKIPMKLADYKPLYGVLAEDLLQPTHTNNQGSARCYTYWGWCDVDGIVGRHLATVLDHYPLQRLGLGQAQGLPQGQGLGLGRGQLIPAAQTQGLGPSVNVCAINTTIHTFYARGMWQSPIFSGQLSVLCNNHQSRNLWQSLGGWKKYLNAKGYSCYDEIHFPAMVRAATKQGLSPGLGSAGPASAPGQGLGPGPGPPNHPIVIEEYHNQAADHHAYTSRTTSMYFVSIHNDIRDFEGKPYVYLHCGHSKNIETKFTQSLESLKIETLGNLSYVIKFDGKQKESSVHLLTSTYVTKNMIT